MDDATEVTPRAMLAAGPAGYVARRTELAAAARAGGDKALAAILKGLAKPGLAHWAVLVAADDAAAIRAAFDATSRLAEIQAGGAGTDELAAATAERRAALRVVTDRAVAALVDATGPSGATRRAEIAALVDRLSRRPDLLDAWLDATLRDLPDPEFGFDAFGDMEISAPSRPERPARAERLVPAAPERPAPSDDEAADRARRAEFERRLADAAAAATRAGRAREEALEETRRLEFELAAIDVQRAEIAAALDDARSGLDAAQRRHDEARAALDAADAALRQ